MKCGIELGVASEVVCCRAADDAATYEKESTFQEAQGNVGMRVSQRKRTNNHNVASSIHAMRFKPNG